MADRKLVLLADRHDDTRTMYGEFLQHFFEFEIDEADDGREALAKAISRSPAVIVTGTWLNGMNGLELCRQLRLNSSTNAIPIIVITAAAGDTAVAEAAGADAVLIKPCLPEVLAAEIGRLLAPPRARTGAGRTRSGASEAQEAVHDRSARPRRGRRSLSATHQRSETRDPQAAPPSLVCPRCDGWLRYLKSQIGGVNAWFAEQWDYFECPRG